MNGLIQQYLPKGIDLSFADQDYLNRIAMPLNTKPRTTFSGRTPLE